MDGKWEQRIEAFVKIKKKNFFFFLGGGGGSPRGWGGGAGGGHWVGGSGCEWRSKVFVKIQKKKIFEGGGWVRGGGEEWSDQELGWGRWG